jgi:hypothetical protein
MHASIKSSKKCRYQKNMKFSCHIEIAQAAEIEGVERYGNNSEVLMATKISDNILMMTILCSRK